jgi:hypothetical protein
LQANEFAMLDVLAAETDATEDDAAEYLATSAHGHGLTDFCCVTSFAWIGYMR